MQATTYFECPNNTHFLFRFQVEIQSNQNFFINSLIRSIQQLFYPGITSFTESLSTCFL